MQDNETTPRTLGGGRSEADEVDAELSRAAREAVRQPADPRLEASFAKLAGVRLDEAPDEPTERQTDQARGPDDRGTEARAGRGTDRPAVSVPAGQSVELETLEAALAGAQARSDQLAGRLERVVWLLVAVVAVLFVVAVLLVVHIAS